ncbi:MAG: DUF4296 domain-containing protein [Bacteroidota bacterium]
MRAVFLRMIFWFLLGAVMLTGCGDKEPPYLSEERMLEILRELHMADVLAEAHGKSLGYRKELRNESYDEVLEVFEISREEFFRNYTYYLNEPEVMDTIYVRMIKDIEKRMQVARDIDYEKEKDKDKWDKDKKKNKQREVEKKLQQKEEAGRTVGTGS